MLCLSFLKEEGGANLCGPGSSLCTISRKPYSTCGKGVTTVPLQMRKQAQRDPTALLGSGKRQIQPKSIPSPESAVFILHPSRQFQSWPNARHWAPELSSRSLYLLTFPEVGEHQRYYLVLIILWSQFQPKNLSVLRRFKKKQQQPKNTKKNLSGSDDCLNSLVDMVICFLFCFILLFTV